MKKIRDVILPSVAGNVLEWYDFTLYAYFATSFARYFFPAEDPFVAMINVYGLFAAGYIMRPVGALFFGYIGDKFGRKYSLTASVLIMGACSAAISILPTYAVWGMYSSISLAIIRLLQGFTVGGEYSGASLLLIETAPPQKRTFFGSLALSSAYSGFVLSALVSAILGLILSPDDMLAYGWRFGFAFGAVIALVGFYMRKHLQEPPPEYTGQPVNGTNPLKNLFQNHKKWLFLAIGIALLPAGLSYMIFVWFSNFLVNYAHYQSEEVLWINVGVMVFAVLCIPVIGWIGDKLGRQLLMLGATILILLFSVPLFGMLLSHALIGMFLLTLLNILYEANLPTEVASLFPRQDRYSGLALTLNLTNGVAGGFAPVIATLLIHYTHELTSPVYYILLLSLVACMSLLFVMYFRTR